MPTAKSTYTLGGDDVQTESHPSYGMLQISRVQGSPGPLYGSSILVHNFIQLRIHPGRVDRHLNQDWYHADPRSIIEVNMSAAQFAEAITTLNCGSGVPCTIDTLNGKRIEQCPATHKRQQIKDEFDEKMQSLSKRFEEGIARISELMKQKTTTVAQRAEVNEIVSRLKNTLSSTLPFIHSQFDEAMDKTVQEAKAEVDAFITHAVVSTGLQALGAKPVSVPMLDDK